MKHPRSRAHCFGRRHEHAGNPLPTVVPVDDQTADEDERFRLEILRENRVDPSDEDAVDLGNEDALIGRERIRRILSAVSGVPRS